MLLCLKMECFFLFTRSKMLPAMRSKIGRAVSDARKPLFYNVSCKLSQQVREISSVVLGDHAENGALENRIFVFCLWPRLVGCMGCVARIFNRRAKMPRFAGKENGVLHFQSQNCHTKLKIRVFEKRPKFFWWAAPILIFVLFGGAPGFSQKTGFPQWAAFRWNHWKRSAKVRTTQFWHGRVWNRPS